MTTTTLPPRSLEFELADNAGHWCDDHGWRWPRAATCDECGRGLGWPTLKPAPQGAESRLPYDVHEQLYRQHWHAGRSVRELLAGVWREWGYRSHASAVNTVLDTWKAQRWPVRSRIAQVRLTNHRKYGPPRPRSERKRAARARAGGQRRCAATTKRGGHCRRWATPGSPFCFNHCPDCAQRRKELAAQWAARELWKHRWAGHVPKHRRHPSERRPILDRVPGPGEGTPYEVALNILRRRKETGNA
jgi:hypothetical protein